MLTDQEKAFVKFADTNEPVPAKSSDISYADLPLDENSWLKTKKASPSIKEQLSNVPKLIAREGAAAFHSLPRETAEAARFIGSKLQQYGEEQAAKAGRVISEEEKELTNKFVNAIPDFLQELGEKFPKVFPTHSQATEQYNEKLKTKSGEKLPKEGRGKVEKFAIGAGRAAPAAIGASPLVTGVSALTSGVTEASDLSENQKLAANLAIPVGTSLAETLLSKRYVPAKGMESLYLKAKEAGLSDKDLAPLLATEGQIERHGPLAAGLSKTRKAFESTGEVLGEKIHELSNRPTASKPLSARAQNNLINKLVDIEDDIRSRTHALSPKEEQYADFIKHMLNDIHANGSTPKQLIGSYRSVGKLGQGKTELRRILDPLVEGIESVDPGIAKDLRTTNSLYSKYISNLKEINPSQFNAFVDAGELQNLLGAVFSGNTASLNKQILNVASVGLLRKLSSSILTNPESQSLVRNFVKAVKDGRDASARSVGLQLKEYVRNNLPEEYKQINWEELGIDQPISKK